MILTTTMLLFVRSAAANFSHETNITPPPFPQALLWNHDTTLIWKTDTKKGNAPTTIRVGTLGFHSTLNSRIYDTPLEVPLDSREPWANAGTGTSAWDRDLSMPTPGFILTVQAI